MQTQKRFTGQPERIAVVFTGKTFALKEILKAEGFRFDRNEIDWCGLPETTGQPLWYKVIAVNDAASELAFTQNMVSTPNLTMILANAEPFL